jgi:Mg-chelatase subunit ChlD
MNTCRTTGKPIPDFALICPHCKTECWLGAAAPPPKPAPRAVPAAAVPAPKAAPAPPAAKPAVARPAAPPKMSPALEEELRRSVAAAEGRLRTGKRRSLLLAAGAAATVLLGLAVLLLYHVTSVRAYAELDPGVRLDRDPSDPDRLVLLYKPLTAGRVGFRRADADRETELLDRVASSGAEQRFEWRWAGVKEGDKLHVTHRSGWSLATKDLAVPAPPPRPPLGDATLAGEVVDATTGKAVSGAEVRLVGTPLRARTGGDGRFRLTEAPAGSVGVEVSAPGYGTDQLDKDLASGKETALRVALSPGMKAGQMRVVLTWGEQPQDLDAHLEGPLPDGKRFHVFFGQKGDLKSKEFVNLDVDAQKGHGPETITVLGVAPGTYRYFVHDYTNRSNKANAGLAESAAEVKVHQGAQAYTFRANQKAVGNIWNVCNIEVGADGKAVVHRLDQYETKLMKDPAAEAVVVLVIDTSGSMAGERIQQARLAADEFLKAVPFEGGARAGLVTFGASTGKLHDLSQDRGSLQKVVGGLNADGGTPMHDGLSHAGRMLQGLPGNRNAILFTDGEPDSAPAALAAATKLKAGGVTVWAIGTGGANLPFLQRVASAPDKATFADLENLRKVFAATAGKIYAPEEGRP